MNNNRGNNNSGGRPQGGGGGGGGGQPLNRIDSRARGNAPQMLEKYKKLAQDAHLNGDRVTAEYYLQFADHYFRVIADTRMRQEEQRRPREPGWQDEGQDAEEGDYVDPDFPTFDQPPPSYARREERPSQDRQNQDRPNQDRPAQDRQSQDRPREDRPREDRPRDDRPREDRPRDERPRDDRPREERSPRQERYAPDRTENAEGETPAAATEEVQFEPAENPFVRENRGTRGLRPRREDRRPRTDQDTASGESTFDAAILPPAISAGRDALRPDVAEDAADEAPVKPRRTRKPRAAEDDVVTVS